MTVLAKVSFNKFLYMRDFEGVKQVYYVKTETEYRMFIVIGPLVYYTTMQKSELLDKDKGIEDTDLARDYAIDVFEQTYIRDGIEVEEFYLPKLFPSDKFDDVEFSIMPEVDARGGSDDSEEHSETGAESKEDIIN